MRSLRTYTLIGFFALSLVLLAACGTTQPSASGSGSTPAYGSTTPTTSSSTSTGDVVKTTSLTVGGKQVSVLTDTKGMTLYTFKPDTATTSACTGACLTTWPPLLFTGTGTPTGADGLTAVTDPSGSQVQSAGHFLYTYSGDTAPGQANGQGLLGKWFVAMAGGSASTGSASASVKTVSLTVGGKQVSVLTDAKGMTLYTFTPDTATTTACTGSCATAWPPLLFTGTGTPTGATGLTAVKDANGNQVQSSGHFLYTYAGDSAPGQANGEGSGGKWFVAMSDGTMDGGAAATAPASNGY